MSNDVVQYDDEQLKQLAAAQAQHDDGFSSDDVAIPTIKLLQGLSDEIGEDDASPGMFWHTGAGESLGAEFEFIICSRRKRYLLMAPISANVEGGPILAQANDGKTWDTTGEWEIPIDKKNKVTWKIEDLDVQKSGLAAWGSFDPEDSNSPPAATLMYEYVVLLPNHLDWGPAVMLITRTAIKRAKKGLNDKILMHQNNGRPMQSVLFKAFVTEESAGANMDYFGWKFAGRGFVNDMAVIQRALKIAESVANIVYDVTDVAPTEGKVDSDEY